MTRTLIVRGLVLALLVGLGVLLVTRTEWVESTEMGPARGAALDDPHYALGAFVHAAGARLERRRNLESLPPPGGTLVLESAMWDLFPGRQAQLRRWVEAGGQLVLAEPALRNQDLRGWVPVDLIDPAVRVASQRHSAASGTVKYGSCPAPAPASASGAVPAPSKASAAVAPAPGASRDDPDDDEDTDVETAAAAAPHAASATSPASAASRPSDADENAIVFRARMRAREHDEHVARIESPGKDYVCQQLAEPAGTPPAMPGRTTYRACFPKYWYLAEFWPRRATPTWSLASASTLRAVRLPVGRGTVTLHDFEPLMSNRWLSSADNAALSAAVLQLHPGQVIWVVDDESQPMLPLWIWEHARPAVLLGALALVLWLWRRAVRFGPGVATADLARRSVGEQVHGIAGFLRRREPASLHRAARRALEDLARRHVADYEQLDEAQRVAVIADLASLPAAPLAAAMRPGPTSPAAQWLAACATLEHARRALRDAVRSR
jgi:hypothetical protein